MKHQIPLNISIVNKSTNFMKKAKSKINIGKSLNNNNKNDQKDQKDKSNRNKNKNKFFSQNSSISNNKKIKKTEPKNPLPQAINDIKKNYNKLQNKLTRNSTFQNLENIKEKSVIINKKNEGSYESPKRISPKNNNQNHPIDKCTGISQDKCTEELIFNVIHIVNLLFYINPLFILYRPKRIV
jgi:hypothetical protein